MIRELIDEAYAEADRFAYSNRDAKEGYVYFVSDGDYIKIGISENIDSRIKGLQIGNARRLMLVEYIWFNSKSAALWAERELHEMYKNKRVLGEWFDIGFDYDFLALISEIRHGPPVCYMDIKTEYNEFMNDRRLSVLRGG